MFRPLTPDDRRPRRGAILIVVLALLTIFAVVALTFVFYADTEATGARIHREGEARGGDDGGIPDAYTVEAIQGFFGQFIYDKSDVTADPNNGLLSVLRGHSLAGNMFGRPVGGTPYSGFGTFHETSPANQDRAFWINYAAPFTIPPGPPNAGTYYVDPEWTGARPAAALNTPPGGIAGLTQNYIPKNAPYTYPDLNNLYLASLSPQTGEVLVPSFHRPWLFNGTNPNVALRLAPWNPNDPNVATNTDWVTPEGRTKILRPRPVDQLTQGEITGAGLPYPLPPGLTGLAAGQLTSLYNLITSKIAGGEIIPYPLPDVTGFNGDVQNYLGQVGPQRNDSLALDIGLPVKQWNGKLIKPLVHVLALDLDGRLSANAHGNVRNNGGHASYAGYGPHEVNLEKVLGSADAAAVVRARYGNVQQWTPGATYAAGAVVYNLGKFYLCVSPAAPGAQAALAPPGPTGSGTTAAPITDGGVTWRSDFSIGIPRNGAYQLPYDQSNTRTPAYAPVNFDGSGSVTAGFVPVQLPQFATAASPMGFTANPFTTSPLFNGNAAGTPLWDDNVWDGPPGELFNKYENHPLLFNPTDWAPTTTGPRTFPLFDLKRLALRFAPDRDWLVQTDLARNGIGNGTLFPTTATGAPTYRLDPTHRNRALLTTHSYDLDRPGLVPNFSSTPTGYYRYTQAAPAQQPGNAASFGQPHSTTVAGTNPGPVDINRPLADYRPTTGLNAPLSTTNAGNYAQAWADRHNLARDIFARLVVATGAQATVFTQVTQVAGVTYQPGDVLVTATAATNPNEYDALRHLAQIAVNMVDATDADDVSTMFVWNPSTGLTAVDSTSIGTLASTNGTAAEVRNRAVFGVEKPRLVLNEVYAESANNPMDSNNANLPNMTATTDGRVRFWVELLNPTSAPYTAGAATAPLGNGSVQLTAGAGQNAYQLVITRNTKAGVGNVAGELVKRDNVLGSVPAGFQPDIIYDFNNAVGRQIAPNNGTYTGTPTPGVVMVGPQLAASAGPALQAEFNPSNAAGAGAQWQAANMIQVPEPAGPGPQENGMSYTLPVANLTSAYLQGQEPQRHVVLLRRLANPYLAPNDPTSSTFMNTIPVNPYITVDYMDWVQAFDAVVYTSPSRVAGDYSTMTSRYATGKVQPYAGFTQANFPGTPGKDTFLTFQTFPNTFVLPQNLATPPTAEPKHTFGRHNGRQDLGTAYTSATYNPTNNTLNGGETIMAPFDWLVHFDRPLVNQLELFSLQATKPHDLTQWTLRTPAAGQPVVRGAGQVAWLGVQPGTDAIEPHPTTGYARFPLTANANNTNTLNGLYRALDLVRVRPRTYGVGLGGRVPGRINLNTIQDKRILQALLDAQSANAFTTAEVDALWTTYITSRTQNLDTTPRFITPDGQPVAGGVPVPGPTVDDLGTQAPPPGVTTPDRPFMGLGVAEFAPNGTALAAGSGLRDTLLRVGADGNPLLWVTNLNTTVQNTSTTGTPHPYLQAEAARKMLNNVTTRSNTFAVWVTVGYYEVRRDPANPANPLTVNEGAGNRPLLGREVYKDIPGDLRQQYFAVVDRSHMGFVPNQQPTIQGQPLYTALSAQATPTSGTGTLTLENLDTTAGGITPLTNPLNPYNLQSVRLYADGKPVYVYGAPAWAASTPYVAGNYVTNAGNVYVCRTPAGTSAAVGNPGPTGTGTGIVDGGVVWDYVASATLVVGTGASQDIVTVTSVDASGNLTVNGLTKPHGAGECVSNCLSGNPGPQPTFDRLTNPNSVYQAVMPYVARIPRTQ